MTLVSQMPGKIIVGVETRRGGDPRVQRLQRAERCEFRNPGVAERRRCPAAHRRRMRSAVSRARRSPASAAGRRGCRDCAARIPAAAARRFRLRGPSTQKRIVSRLSCAAQPASSATAGTARTADRRRAQRDGVVAAVARGGSTSQSIAGIAGSDQLAAFVAAAGSRWRPGRCAQFGLAACLAFAASLAAPLASSVAGVLSPPASRR